MISVGLTGNVGAGKSTVAALFRDWGATVIDTDDLAREVVAAGGPAIQRIREIWGDDVITPDGNLDRAAMRRIAFADPAHREKLEAILHPAIRERFRELLAEAEARGDPVVIGVVPLLYEVGMDGEFDVVLLVDAPEEQRIDRIVTTRELGREEARAIAEAQMPAKEKRALAEFIIDNDSDIPNLERRAWEMWKELEKLTAAR